MDTYNIQITTTYKNQRDQLQHGRTKDFKVPAYNPAYAMKQLAQYLLQIRKPDAVEVNIRKED